MHREIVDWLTSNISAQISSMMLLRSYPQATISASRKVSSRGRPDPLSQGSSSNSVTRTSSSSSCSRVRPDIRLQCNGFSVMEGVCENLLSIERRGRCLLSDAECRQFSRYSGNLLY